jgi:hypothetical protein
MCCCWAPARGSCRGWRPWELLPLRQGGDGSRELGRHGCWASSAMEQGRELARAGDARAPCAEKKDAASCSPATWRIGTTAMGGEVGRRPWARPGKVGARPDTQGEERHRSSVDGGRKERGAMVGSSTTMGGPCAHKGTEGRNSGEGNGGRRGVVPWRPCSCAGCCCREQRGRRQGVWLVAAREKWRVGVQNSPSAREGHPYL